MHVATSGAPWRALRVSAAAVLALAGAVLSGGEPVADAAGFGHHVAPFLRAHCLDCHGPTKAKAKLRVDDLTPVVAGADIQRWKAIAERVVLHEMPPSSEARPDPAASAALVTWIRRGLAQAGPGADIAETVSKLQLPGYGNRVDHEALFSGKQTAPAASPARVWRLRPEAYEHFLLRMLGEARLSPRQRIPQPFSTLTTPGFRDYAELYQVDEPTIGQLMRNAEALAAMQLASKRHAAFRPLIDPAKPATPEQVDAAITAQFELVLWRKPTDEELRRFRALHARNLATAAAPLAARSTLATVLMLPEATYRIEQGGDPDVHGRRMLRPRDLAYALAYALNDDGPDARLLAAAENGNLSTREGVRREVERLLADASFAKPRIMRFFEEYFDFTSVEGAFKDGLSQKSWRPSLLVNDTRHLVRWILERDRDVLKELLTTDRGFVAYRENPDAPGGASLAMLVNGKGWPPPPPKDAKEAEQRKRVPPERKMEYWDLYGMPENWQFTPEQPIKLGGRRAGILTQPSWLAGMATNNETDAIHRGKWVRERLLGGVISDVPINVDAQLPDAPDKTMRERLKVTEQEYCWQCHKLMNPLGVAFERYDYLGRERAAESVLDPEATAKNVDSKGRSKGTVMREVPIDATSELARTGIPSVEGQVQDAVEMIHRLAGTERVRQVFVRHAFRFWMGRNEQLSDSPTLIAADKAYVAAGGSMKALITSLLTSDAFLYRYHPAAAPTAAR